LAFPPALIYCVLLSGHSNLLWLRARPLSFIFSRIFSRKNRVPQAVYLHSFEIGK
jgi:hypothetical protein